MTTIAERIKELDERIYALECSDDMLFTNANGNRARWEEMVAERSRLRRMSTPVDAASSL